MSRTNRYWALALGAAFGFVAPAAHAQEDAWRPTASSAAVMAPSGPAASIGRPVPIDEPDGAPSLPPLSTAEDHLPPVQAEPIPETWSEGVILRAQATEPQPPPVPPPGPPPIAPYTVDPSVDVTNPVTGPGRGGHFWDNIGGKSCKFQSDHAFDTIVSPVGNPFYFEDPRALTEVRPIFLYQQAPHSTPVFNGGHSEFFGLQARVALTDRWSIVMNKLGFVSLRPNDPTDDVPRDTGFAEVDIGPKWTFYRNENTGSVVATGLTFQIPTGRKADQNTGTLGLVPYITYAQNFGCLGPGFRSFNFLGEAGYSFATDSQRSQFFQTSLHVDYDVANLHRFYPLAELNWFYTTRRGDARDLTFEGNDLVNFGSRDLSNRNLVTMDLGARYKVREWLQFGAAVELPLTSHKELTEYRLLFDVIIRY